jgi:hypothetical protein
MGPLSGRSAQARTVPLKYKECKTGAYFLLKITRKQSKPQEKPPALLFLALFIYQQMSEYFSFVGNFYLPRCIRIRNHG